MIIIFKVVPDTFLDCVPRLKCFKTNVCVKTNCIRRTIRAILIYFLLTDFISFFFLMSQAKEKTISCIFNHLKRLPWWLSW